MSMHAFWWDVYIVFKKRETCAFLSHLIYNFTVYIVNNTASPYVAYSIKHLYFNHLVGLLEKKCASRLTVFCVGSQRRIQSWHLEGPNRELNVSFIVRDLKELTTWMLESTFIIFTQSSFLFFFFFLLLASCSHVHVAQTRKKKKMHQVMEPWVVAVEMICSPEVVLSLSTANKKQKQRVTNVWKLAYAKESSWLFSLTTFCTYTTQLYSL